MNIDRALKDVGNFGYYQKKLILVFCLPLQLYTAIQVCQLIFVGAKPDFGCKDTNWKHNVCENGTAQCKKFVYYSNFTSIATEWDLVCNLAYLPNLAQTITMLGFLFGAPVAGWCADRYGRLRTFLPLIIATVIVSIASSFTATYNQYAYLRFIIGFCVGGQGLVSIVLLTEMVGPQYRALVSTIVSASFAIGLMVYALCGYLVREWRQLCLVTTVPGLFFVSYKWLLVESPQWLASQKKEKQVKSVLRVIAQENNTSDTYDKLYDSSNCFTPEKEVTSRQSTYSVLDLFKYKSLRRLTLIQSYIWAVNGCVYYGLTMSAGDLGSNMYISLCLSGLVELPAYAVTTCLLSRIGRKPTLIGFLLVGGISCMVILVIPKGHGSLEVPFALIGKLSISATFAVIYVHTAELYPTVIRNLGMGVCSMAARVGGMMAPLISHLGEVHTNLQFLIFGAMTFAAGLVGLMLRETMNHTLPDTIEELTGSKAGQELRSLSEAKVRLLEEVIRDDGEEEVV